MQCVNYEEFGHTKSYFAFVSACAKTQKMRKLGKQSHPWSMLKCVKDLKGKRFVIKQKCFPSLESNIKMGVPHGSSLGPILSLI